MSHRHVWLRVFSAVLLLGLLAGLTNRHGLITGATGTGKTVTLQANAGGADDDLRKSFTVTDFAGMAREGAWTLGVSDRAACVAEAMRRGLLE